MFTAVQNMRVKTIIEKALKESAFVSVLFIVSVEPLLSNNLVGLLKI